MEKDYSVIVAGGGIAGISAAIQLKKIGIDFLLIERNKLGGIINDIYSIENYPGYFDPITGKNFTKNLEKQIETLKIKPLFNSIEEIDYDDNKFIVKLDDMELRSNYLVLATGSKPILPINYDNYSTDLKKNTHFELDSLKRDKTTILIGGGPKSYDYALSISEYGEVIFLEVNSHELPYYYQLKRLSKKDEIKLITGTQIKDISYKDGKIEVSAFYEGRQGVVKGDQLFVSKGREPDTSTLSDRVFKKESRLVRDKKLYYAGDCYYGKFRFLTTSAGDGITAAKQIYQDVIFNRIINTESIDKEF
ncbi:MAG: hypothetical protein CR982_06245 [Candidatus Cloacimonadota bacterium]|nr:MAG: hypothetical protein CR982_06245 [Candidatus Cloacimonadota bacterium]PIE78121.1 MAG: hypothetical protein CSA15_09805 [Candidatus Delongbacteria bacterium]